MAVEQVHHHRPTLKQTNKPFKSKHASKSSIKKQAKGRISRQSPKAGHAQSDAAQLRMNRKNAAKQAQLRKRDALVSATRIFNGVDGAPRIVAVVPLCEDVSSRMAGTTLSQSLDPDAEAGPDFGLRKLKADRFKTSLQFIHLPYRHLYAALDACKVADYVVFVLSSSIEVDAWGDMLLRALQAQGLPHVVACVASGLPSEDKKTRTGIVKSLLSFMQYFVPSLSRVFDLASSSDCANALRSLCEGHPADVRWRSGRPYLLAEDVRWEVGEDTNGGHLHVTGIVRGAPLSANRLVHIPNHGDYQVEKIMSAPLPRSGRGAGMEIEPSLLAEPDSENADSLISTNVPDDLANEQTWPTEEEMQGAEPGNEEQLPDAHRGTTPRRVKRVPKGWSEYQAAWIVDSEDEEGGEDDEDEQSVDEDSGKDGDVGMKGESETRGAADEEDEEEMVDLPEADMETSTHKSVHFQDLDIEEETRQLGAWRSRDRAKEEAEDAAFPDELDTPQDIPARVRFQRYRGLRSFRTSPWDAYENLPRDYARIFQFEDFRRTERNVRKRMEAEGYGIEPGTRVTLMLKNVPEDAAKVDPSHQFVLFGLLQHEHKVTVLNFAVQRNTEYDVPVRSKDPLILCYGPRRLRTNPTYSQHTRGGGKGVNNVHKFERWLRHGETSVATTFGPIVFGNQPCMLLRETGDPQAPELVAMGSFLNTDTTRIVAKRIILTGHPFKVHRKTATVRYMFFNPEDVAYFAPVQLHTKYGRMGHIKDSLGTHGYFKAHFDGPINQMDTVCMSLYKRVYPRWPTTFRHDGNVQGDDVDDSADAMEE
ncbi:TSR1 [Sanghuangporus sanghuang]